MIGSPGTVAVALRTVAWARPSEAANSGFVSQQGGEFVLNGSPFRFVDTNAYFMLDAATYGSTAHTDGMLSLANGNGFTKSSPFEPPAFRLLGRGVF